MAIRTTKFPDWTVADAANAIVNLQNCDDWAQYYSRLLRPELEKENSRLQRKFFGQVDPEYRALLVGRTKDKFEAIMNAKQEKYLALHHVKPIQVIKVVHLHIWRDEYKRLKSKKYHTLPKHLPRKLDCEAVADSSNFLDDGYKRYRQIEDKCAAKAFKRLQKESPLKAAVWEAYRIRKIPSELVAKELGITSGGAGVRKMCQRIEPTLKEYTEEFIKKESVDRCIFF